MPPKSVPPHYECLGVDPSISDADLSRHYKKLSLQLHPDRVAYRNDRTNEVHVQARYQRITEAYAVLSDPEKRNAYDTKHGVNFQSRLVRLQAMIDEHNTTAVLRSSAATATLLASTDATTDSVDQLNGAAAAHNVAKELLPEDEDDDYDPSTFVSTGSSSSSTVHRGGCFARHGCDVDGEGADGHDNVHENGEWARNVRQMFHLHPHISLSTPDTGVGVTEDGVPVTKYLGVTLTRIRTQGDSTALDTATAQEPGAQWGLVLDRNILVGLRSDASEKERGENKERATAIEGLTEVLFPAAVQQVNETMVREATDIAALLDSAAKKTVAVTDEACDVRLELVLAFCSEKYDLLGDTCLLLDDAVLYDVVPRWCVAAEMPALLPSVRVLSVNGIPVYSAEDLRNELRKAVSAQPSISDRGTSEDGASTAKRPRKTRTVVLELCHLPFFST